MQPAIILTATLPFRRPIWRQLRVPLSCTFLELHAILQLAFGWTNGHLFKFIFTTRRSLELYRHGDLNIAVGEDVEDVVGEPGFVFKDARETQLREHVKPRCRFLYHYDWGDDWAHVIKAGRLDRTDVPECLNGALACPPEDSGGLHGYSIFADAAADPTDERHQAARQWLAKRRMADWQPDVFDLAAANERIRRFWKSDLARHELRRVPLAGLGNNLEAKRYVEVWTVGKCEVVSSMGPFSSFGLAPDGRCYN